MANLRFTDITYINLNNRKFATVQPFQKKYMIKIVTYYTLLIRSKKPNAEQFFIWVIEDVLPSIRKNGIYVANKKQMKKIKELNQIIDQKDEELKEKTLQIKTLENNHLALSASL